EICDIEHELVVAPGVFPCKFLPDIDSYGLSSAFEMQQGPSLCEGVGNRDVRSIPAVAAVVGNIRVAAAVCIKTMRHGARLPDSNLFAVPCLPWSAQRALEKLPSVGESTRVGHVV